MVPCKSTAEEVSFEWSHHRISSTESKVRTTLHVFIIDTGSERDDFRCCFIDRCLSVPAAMRCIIRKAQSVKLEELPVKTSEELLLPLGFGQPNTKLASLSLPPSAALFAAAVGTPSNPNTPVFLGTSPSFTAFTLETPSPTFSAFQFSSISPTFSFPNADLTTAASEATATANKQDKKPDTPKQSSLPNPLKITLKRKRDDEYVIEKFQLPEEIPKNEGKLGQGVGSTPKGGDLASSDSSTMDGENFSFDLAAMSGANFGLGASFQDVTAGLDGSTVSSGSAAAMATPASIAAASGLGIVPAGIEGLPATADLFDIGAAGADGSELEGILQNLSGVSHLPPGIVSGGSALDFDAGLGVLRVLCFHQYGKNKIK